VWEQLSEIVGIAVGAAVLYLIKLLISNIHNAQLKAAIMTALRVGVHHVQEEFVVWKKRENSDNKLTKKERNEAMIKAKEQVLSSRSVKNSIKNKVANLSYEELNSYIKEILKE
jgi:membrane-bound lytic murein transglycosylase MltF